MYAYVLRRVLLMVPTLFGISMVIWLVMALSPGRVGERKGGMSEQERSQDAQKDARKDESQRIFRRNFGLDRPLFWNDWHDLDTDSVGADVRLQLADIQEVGATAKREARERLEDYGYYAVPALVSLLERTEGEEQNEVLYWLQRNSYRIPERRYGEELDEEEIERFRAWARENAMLRDWTWPRGAPAEARAPIARQWTEWFESNRDRWSHDFWSRLRISLTDTQFGTYWGRLVQGDLGVSHIHKRPVGELVLERLKYSLSINVVALLISLSLAVPLGIYSAVKAGRLPDRIIAILLFMLYSLPNFFVGTLLLKWLATGEPWQVFPSAGFESEDAVRLNTWEHLKDVLWHITLPLICLSYVGLAVLSRYSRTGMLDVIRSDYVRTARAKGLSEWTVILKHVVRNGILPIVTILGTSLPVLISGSVVIEWIFNINGMGLLMINSIYQKDFNVVMGVQLIAAVLTMVGILLSDLAYAVLDPRISLS